MSKPWIRKYNTHPEFIGIQAFIQQIKEISEILRQALENRDYDTARNSEYVHLLFPSSKPGKFGYKYVIYDEIEYIEREASAQLAEGQKYFMAAFGFEVDKGRFTLQVPPVDIRNIDIEFMRHIEEHRQASFPRENFIAGFIDCGFSMANDSAYWLELRSKQDAARILKVEATDNILSYYVANGDSLEYKGDVYDADTLVRKTKWIRTLERDDDYHYLDLVEDNYGRLWGHQYTENDHIYHIEHIYRLVQDRMNPDHEEPYFRITKGTGIESLELHFKLRQQTTNDFIQKEIMKVKRLNGWIPDVCLDLSKEK